MKRYKKLVILVLIIASVILLSTMYFLQTQQPPAEQQQANSYDSQAWLTFKSDLWRTGYAKTISYDWTFKGEVAWVNDKIGLSGPPIAFNGKVYAVSNNHLHALNLSTGAELWSTPVISGYITSPASDGKNIYLGAGQGGLTSYNPDTGKTKLTIKEVAASAGSLAIQNGKAFTTSIVSDAASNESYPLLQAVNLNTGDTLWTYKLPSGQFSNAPLTVGNVSLFASTSNRSLDAFTIDSGKPLWSKTFNDSIVESPIFSWGLLFIATYDGQIYAVNATTGNELWTANLSAIPAAEASSNSTSASNTIRTASDISSLALAHGKVYVGTPSGVYALRAETGRVFWHYDSNGTFTSPAIASRELFIGNYRGELIELDVDTGELLWKYSNLGEGPVSAPIIGQGIVVISSSHGVFAFR